MHMSSREVQIQLKTRKHYFGARPKYQNQPSKQTNKRNNESNQTKSTQQQQQQQNHQNLQTWESLGRQEETEPVS